MDWPQMFQLFCFLLSHLKMLKWAKQQPYRNCQSQVMSSYFKSIPSVPKYPHLVIFLKTSHL